MQDRPLYQFDVPGTPYKSFCFSAPDDVEAVTCAFERTGLTDAQGAWALQPQTNSGHPITYVWSIKNA